MTDPASTGTPAGEPDHRQRYFGRRWNAPAFMDAIKVETPLGAVCLFCDELVDEHDSGLITPALLAEGPTMSAVHLECHLRSVLGCVAHLEQRCSCYGGGDHEGHDRAAARAVLAFLIAEQEAAGLPHPGFAD